MCPSAADARIGGSRTRGGTCERGPRRCSRIARGRIRAADPQTLDNQESIMKPKNTICLWFDKDALDAARFYAATFPNSTVTAVHHAPADFPSGKKGDVLTVDFTVCGIP